MKCRKMQLASTIMVDRAAGLSVAMGSRASPVVDREKFSEPRHPFQILFSFFFHSQRLQFLSSPLRLFSLYFSIEKMSLRAAEDAPVAPQLSGLQ